MRLCPTPELYRQRQLRNAAVDQHISGGRYKRYTMRDYFSQLQLQLQRHRGQGSRTDQVAPPAPWHVILGSATTVEVLSHEDRIKLWGLHVLYSDNDKELAEEVGAVEGVGRGDGNQGVDTGTEDHSGSGAEVDVDEDVDEDVDQQDNGLGDFDPQSQEHPHTLAATLTSSLKRSHVASHEISTSTHLTANALLSPAINSNTICTPSLATTSSASDCISALHSFGSARSLRYRLRDDMDTVVGADQNMGKNKNVKDKKPIWRWGPKSSSEDAMKFYTEVWGSDSDLVLLVSGSTGQ
jgi:hypothetical protein